MSEKLPLALCRSTETGIQQKYTAAHACMGRQPGDCVFCLPNPEDIREKGEDMFVLDNIFPYDMWDRFEVEDHAMIIPIRHTLQLGDLTRDERLEWMDTIASYEARGYSNYTRSPENKSKSIPHLHTHVILLGRRALTRQWYDVESQTSLFRFEGDGLDDGAYQPANPVN